jgi:hypothetical protein
LKQTGTHDQVETKSSAATQGSAASGGAVLAVRLWTQPEEAESGPASDPSYWKSAAPAVLLIVDLIAASEGVATVTHGKIMAASFSSPQTAITAARRLQWAIQGFSEAEKLKGTAISVLVCSAEEVSGKGEDHSFLLPLEKAAPGQILLTERSCQRLDELPIFSLKASSVTGLRELLWRETKGDSTRSSDERKVAQLIEQHGSQELARPAEKTIVGPSVGNENAKAPATNVLRDTTPPEVSASLPGGKSRWLIGGVCAAVLLVVVAGIIAMSHKGKIAAGSAAPAAKAISSSTTGSSTTGESRPVVSQPTPPEQVVRQGPSVVPNISSPKESKAAAKAAERSKKDKDKEEHAQQKAVEEPVAPTPAPAPSAPPKRGNCELDAQELPDLIDAGERSLARGHYGDAERQFGAVLGCEPGNGRARAGLERARRAVQANGSSR